jgi:hypothetical protein
MRTALSFSAARSAGTSASGTTSANGSTTAATVAVSRAATLAGYVVGQGSGKSIAIVTSTIARFAEQRPFQSRGHLTHCLTAHTPDNDAS